MLLPGLFPELAAAIEGRQALRKLLRHARREHAVAGDSQAWLCRFFGVARQQDWPVAPFAALGDGLAPGADYWLCADPVSLLLQRDSFTVADGSRALHPEQAQQLIDALNTHFAEDGMRFFAPQAHRWYLRLAQSPQLQTTPLAQAMGRNVQPLLPQGADSLQWHGWLNEVQMLLHGHPVNLDLEQRGELPVNSVWPWGGGVLPSCAPRGNTAVWTDDPLARGLALAHGHALAPLPQSAREWLQNSAEQTTHLIVPARAEPAEMLQALERDWFAPLLQMLRDGGIARLTLHLAGRNVNSFTVTRGDLRKFWRRSRPLETYLG